MILAGERLAEVPGALSALARLAWIPAPGEPGPGDLPAPEAALAAAARFVVSLELRVSAVTDRADVVLPSPRPRRREAHSSAGKGGLARSGPLSASPASGQTWKFWAGSLARWTSAWGCRTPLPHAARSPDSAPGRASGPPRQLCPAARLLGPAPARM